MASEESIHPRLRDEALRIARLDAEKAYRDLSPYRVLVELDEAGWHIDYELKNQQASGGGAHLGARTGLSTMTERLKHLEVIFPNLAAAGYSAKSRKSPVYNCIAYAAGDETRKWEGFHELGYLDSAAFFKP